MCTPYRADAEPRGPRHARAIAELPSRPEVVFFDCAPLGHPRVSVPALEGLSNLRWVTHRFPTRRRGLLQLVRNHARSRAAELIFRATGHMRPEILSPAVVGARRALRALGADVIYAHNIEMLLPAARALAPRGRLLFDCMEFYSDMGEGQSLHQREVMTRVERELLPRCALVTTSSPQVSAAYEETYGIANTLPLYNCPARVEHVAAGPTPPGLRLYWRNSVLGLGQRGLEEALDALVGLPAEVSLHLQGRPELDGGAALRREVARRGLDGRVHVLPPHGPDQAVAAAAAHSVGLCLERRVNRNHEVTVSNKIFDYMMAGLAVIASDLPGLAEIVRRSGGGLLFQPGSVASLRDCVERMAGDPGLLARARSNARAFALEHGNREAEMIRFKRRVVEVIPELAGERC